MYARLVLVTLGRDARPKAEDLADRFAMRLAELKGFKAVTFFADDTAGEYGSLSLWESKEDAEAVTTLAGPQIRQDLRDIAKGPPRVRLFEVYEPTLPGMMSVDRVLGIEQQTPHATL